MVEVGSHDTHSRRRIFHILGQNGAGRAGSLLVSELYGDPGCWSGYPPHKHDTDRLPVETNHEEIYHYRYRPETGFGAQFRYDADGGGEEPEVVMTRHGDTYCIDHGYHPTLRAPGHEGYIFTILVGRQHRGLVQSFEPSSLKEMKAKGLLTPKVQLIDADDYNLKTGALSYAAPYDRPYDWFKAGDKRLFSAMVTPAGLAEIKTYAEGIGPWKPYIIPVKGQLDASGNLRDINGDGAANLRDASSQAPTTLIADAHRAGLFVHAYTFRNEKRRLTADFNGDPQAEYLLYYRLGLDGLFSDFPDTGIAARAAYLKEMGR